jgi:hypothetical protein
LKELINYTTYKFKEIFERAMKKMENENPKMNDKMRGTEGNSMKIRKEIKGKIKELSFDFNLIFQIVIGRRFLIDQSVACGVSS